MYIPKINIMCTQLTNILTQVCMPGLHIGTVCLSCLRVIVHLLDIKLAESSRQDDSLHSFKMLSTAHHHVAKLEENTVNEEEASAAEQLSTLFAVRWMVGQAAAKLLCKIATSLVEVTKRKFISFVRIRRVKYIKKGQLSTKDLPQKKGCYSCR